MIIRLTHPKHGTHLAYSEAEAQTCEGNGWIREQAIPATPAPVPDEAIPAQNFMRDIRRSDVKRKENVR